MKQCILENKECTNCGRCDDRCELDPNKICDNCFRCLEAGEAEYLEIPISGVYTAEDYLVEEPVYEASKRTHVSTLPGMYAERLKK